MDYTVPAVNQIVDIILNSDNTIQFVFSNGAVMTTGPINIFAPIYARNLFLDTSPSLNNKTATIPIGHLEHNGDQVNIKFGAKLVDGLFTIKLGNKTFFSWDYPEKLAQNYTIRAELDFRRYKSYMNMIGHIYMYNEGEPTLMEHLVLDQTSEMVNYASDLVFELDQAGATFRDININLIKRPQ